MYERNIRESLHTHTLNKLLRLSVTLCLVYVCVNAGNRKPVAYIKELLHTATHTNTWRPTYVAFERIFLCDVEGYGQCQMLTRKERNALE